MTHGQISRSSPAALLNRRLPFFYGYVIVAIGFLASFMMGATSFWAMPIFVGAMNEDTGWSHTSILAGLSVHFIMGGAGVFIASRFADRHGGASRILLVGVLITASALFSLRWVDSPAQFIFLYGFVAGAGNSALRILMATLVSKWFIAKRGIAVGVATSGGAVSGILMVPLITLFISELGWRDAWSAIAAILVVLLLPMVPLAVRSPEDLGLKPDNGARPVSTRPAAGSEHSFTLHEAIRTRTFGFLMVAVLIGNFALQTNTTVMVPYFEDLGFSAATAASAIAAYGFVALCMRFVWGTFADRLGVRAAVLLQACITAFGAFLLLQINGTGSLFLITIYQGATQSAFPLLQLLVWPAFFGRSYVGSIVGVGQPPTVIAGAAGPLVVGFLFDQTGNHETTLLLLIGSWLATAAVMYTIKPAKRADAAATPPS